VGGVSAGAQARGLVDTVILGGRPGEYDSGCGEVPHSAGRKKVSGALAECIHMSGSGSGLAARQAGGAVEAEAGRALCWPAAVAEFARECGGARRQQRAIR
jgi:hypothetical protein